MSLLFCRPLALAARRTDSRCRFFHRGKDFPRTADHISRQSRQLCHLDAVAVIGGTAHDFAQKGDTISPLFGGNVVVDDAAVFLLHDGQLMIMRGKQRLCADSAAVGILHNGAGNAHSVVSGGSSAHLVVDDQAFRRRIFQNIRHLIHFQHEGGLPRRQVIGCPDAGENLVHNPDMRLRRRHKRADLRKQNDQSRLPHISRFSRHIRSRDQHHPVVPGVKQRVVGHKVTVTHKLLHHRMPPVADVHLVRHIHHRTDILFFRRHGRKRHINVDLRKQCRRPLDTGTVLGNLRTHLLEKIILHRLDFIAGAQNGLLQLFELRRHIPLAVRKRLLADIAVRDLPDQGFCHLYVIAEHVVVPDAQRLDSRCLPFARLQAFHPFLAVVPHRALIVQLLIVSCGNDAAIPDQKRRIRQNGGFDQCTQILQGIQFRVNPPELITAAPFKKLTHFRQNRRRRCNGTQIPSVGGAVHNPGDQPLHIQHVGKQFPHLFAQKELSVQLLHRALPFGDAGNIQERMLHPLAQKTRAGRGTRFVKHPKQRAALLFGTHGFGQFQVPPGVDVQIHILPLAVDVQFLNIGNIPLLHIRNIGKQGAERTDHLAVPEGLFTHAVRKLCPDALRRLFIVKPPRLFVRDHGAGSADDEIRSPRKGGNRQIGNHLTGRIGSDLVDQARVWVVPGDGGGKHLSGGHIRKADTVLVLAKADRAQIIVLLVGQQIGLDQRSGRDNAHHLTPDQSLGKRRVLHLLTDGDFESLSDQLTDILVHGVVRDSAHGRAFLFPAIPSRQRQSDGAGRGDRVVKKHLVKIPQAIKEQIIFILLLDLQVLFHHRCHGAYSSPAVLCACGFSSVPAFLSRSRTLFSMPLSVRRIRRTWSSHACTRRAAPR
ncbi:uncharacterized protein BN660_01255 [Clostridium sp. CAG:448]|nr:uncharacterized protein BN660_01255 [Clostridium sp. CAG:448]